MDSLATPKDGFLLVDKIAGITSHDAVERVRRRIRIKKIGHTGTLDPMATGLLILCVGKATRLQSYLMKMEKTYEGVIQFGWATNTYDAEGEQVGEKREIDVTNLDLSSMVERFRGDIEQTPPAFSAKKVQGVRSYELARRGEATVLEPKKVQIKEFQILAAGKTTAEFRVTCSAGTYVRSIANDLGELLGVGGHLASLRRTAIGNFQVDQALSVNQLNEILPEQVLSPPHFLRMHEIDLPLERMMVDRSQEAKLSRGQTVVIKPTGKEVRFRELVSVANVDQELVAIAEVVEVLRPDGGPVVLQPKVVLKV